MALTIAVHYKFTATTIKIINFTLLCYYHKVKINQKGDDLNVKNNKCSNDWIFTVPLFPLPA